MSDRDYSVAELRAMFNPAGALLENTPHIRPGYPNWMLFTGAQWRTHDQLHALYDEMERKYSQAVPSMFTPTMRATMRTVY